MADGHWIGHWIGHLGAPAIGSATAIFGGGASFLLALSSETEAAWAALMVAGGGLATAIGGQLIPILRMWLDSLRLREQLESSRAKIAALEEHGERDRDKIAALEEKGKRDRTTIRRNFSLIKGMMDRMSRSTVLEIVRIQEEKDEAERARDPAKSLIIPPFDADAVVPEYEPPSEHDLGPPGTS